MTVTDNNILRTGARATSGRNAHRLDAAYLGYLLLLLTGALQRPLGGGDLEGSMTGTVITGGNPVFKALMAGTIGLTLLILLANLKRVQLPKGSGLALAFNLLAFLSVFWSPAPATTFQGAIGLAFPALVAVYAWNFFDWDELARVLVRVMAGLVLVTGVLAAVAPGYSFHSANEFFYMHAGLLKGTYVHKNSLGVALTLALIVLVTLGRSVLSRRIWLVTIVLAFWLILLTGSAKSLVSVPTALLAGYVAIRVRSRTLLWILLVYFVGSVALMVSVVGSEALLIAGTDALGRDVTFSGRTLIWQTAMDYTLNAGHWLAGGGLDAAWNAGIGEYSQQQIGFNAGHPHNGFIAIFIDVGLLGLGLIGVISLQVMNRALARDLDRSRRFFMMSMLVMILVTNLGGTSLTLPFSMSWFLMAILSAAPYWRRSGG